MTIHMHENLFAEGWSASAILDSTMPPRDPKDSDDDQDDEDDDTESRENEPAVVREPDGDE